MPRPRVSLKISQRGLILIAVPLLFEFCFSASLFILLQQAEHDKQQEYESKLLILELTDINTLFWNCMAVIAKDPFQVSDTSSGLESFADKLHTRIESIKSRVGNNPHEQEHVRKIEILTNQLIVTSFRLRQRFSMHSQSGFLTFFELRTQFSDLGKALMKELNELADERRKVTKQDPDAASRSAMFVKLALVLGVILSSIISVLLATFFSRGITRRLHVLSENSTRLAHGQALNKVMEGTDEIAMLDKVFHDMAEALTIAMRKERAVTENAADVICSVSADGKILQINPAVFLICGYKPEELVGKEITDIVASDDVSATAAALQQLSSKGGQGTIENQLMQRNGRPVFTNWSLRWSEEEQAAFCVIHDVTAKMEMEKLKQRFFSMISHDLRTPISSITTTLELLRTGVYGDLPDQINLTMHRLEQTAHYVSSLITNLLELERLQAGGLPMQLESVILGAVIERGVETVEPVAESKSITLSTTGTTLLPVLADPERILQVLVNLLSNAIKYSPERSVVYVEVAKESQFVEVSVRDTGCGISEEHLHAIFDAFKQVEVADATEKKGFGLGLSICKAIVEQHGGSIGVRSKVGEGSTFWFRLKTVPERAVLPEELDSASRPEAVT